MEIEYEKVMVAVFTENKIERRKYFNLFALMLKDKILTQIYTRDNAQFETDKFLFKFLPKNMSARGHKAHYVLNLTQNVDFEREFARPITTIHDYLKRDEKWYELFEGLE